MCVRGFHLPGTLRPPTLSTLSLNSEQCCSEPYPGVGSFSPSRLKWGGGSYPHDLVFWLTWLSVMMWGPLSRFQTMPILPHSLLQSQLLVPLMVAMLSPHLTLASSQSHSGRDRVWLLEQHSLPQTSLSPNTRLMPQTSVSCLQKKQEEGGCRELQTEWCADSISVYLYNPACY